MNAKEGQKITWFASQSRAASEESPRSLFLNINGGDVVSVFTNTVRTQNWLENGPRYGMLHVMTVTGQVERGEVVGALKKAFSNQPAAIV